VVIKENNMIELTPRGYDSQEYDIDGNTTYADLKINNIVRTENVHALEKTINYTLYPY
jgi:hypothetical protein